MSCAVLLLTNVLVGRSRYEYDKEMSWFAHHPASMLVAFVALGGNAALIKKKGGYTNTKMHGNVLSLALSIALFGTYVLSLSRWFRWLRRYHKHVAMIFYCDAVTYVC